MEKLAIVTYTSTPVWLGYCSVLNMELLLKMTGMDWLDIIIAELAFFMVAVLVTSGLPGSV